MASRSDAAVGGWHIRRICVVINNYTDRLQWCSSFRPSTDRTMTASLHAETVFDEKWRMKRAKLFLPRSRSTRLNACLCRLVSWIFSISPSYFVQGSNFCGQRIATKEVERRRCDGRDGRRRLEDSRRAASVLAGIGENEQPCKQSCCEKADLRAPSAHYVVFPSIRLELRHDR
jgi:hypothetical protein